MAQLPVTDDGSMNADDNSRFPPVQSPQLRSDHRWYNSIFTQLLAPLVATRYIWLAIEEINPLNFLGKTKPPGEGVVKPWKEVGVGRYLSRNFAALGMGATFFSIVGFYSRNTLRDIRSIYAEAVGYELNKKPDDVTLGDIFFKSQNEALATTRHAYSWRTLARIATASAFFMPWHRLRDFKSTAPKYEANANVGVGAIGAYLYGEGFLRKPSFFDIEQKTLSNIIAHKDIDPYSVLQPSDIESLLVLARKHRDANYQSPPAASPEGQQDIKLASRIAELMNQTYGNIPAASKAHFTIGKFNFLVGFGLLDHFPASLGFVELANRSTDMHEVKDAMRAIKQGQDPRAVLAHYGVDMGLTQAAPAALHPPVALSTDSAKPLAQVTADSPRAHHGMADQKPALQQGVV